LLTIEVPPLKATARHPVPPYPPLQGISLLTLHQGVLYAYYLSVCPCQSIHPPWADGQGSAGTRATSRTILRSDKA